MKRKRIFEKSIFVLILFRTASPVRDKRPNSKVKNKKINRNFPFYFYLGTNSSFCLSLCAVDLRHTHAVSRWTENRWTKKRNEFSLARRSRDSYRAFVSKNVLFSRNVNVVDGIAAAALLPPPPPPPNVAQSCGAHAMAKPFKISLTPLHWSKSVNWTFDAFCLVVADDAVVLRTGWEPREPWDMPGETPKRNKT